MSVFSSVCAYVLVYYAFTSILIPFQITEINVKIIARKVPTLFLCPEPLTGGSPTRKSLTFSSVPLLGSGSMPSSAATRG